MTPAAAPAAATDGAKEAEAAKKRAADAEAKHKADEAAAAQKKRDADQQAQAAAASAAAAAAAAPAGSANKAAALAEKEKGTAAYKKRDFETALAHYTRAHELDPEDMSIITNRAAVYLESGDLPACIATCKQAIDIGRAHRADFKLIARAFARMGNAYAKQENWQEAINAYNKSLTEERTAEVTSRTVTLDTHTFDIFTACQFLTLTHAPLSAFMMYSCHARRCWSCCARPRRS